MTHYNLYKLFRELAAANVAIKTFQSGPGEYFPTNPSDDLFPILYLEQEQTFGANNALDRRGVAFWILDRTFAEAATPAELEDLQNQCLSKCEQTGRLFIQQIGQQFPDSLPNPLVYNGVAVPITGADRAFGYRFEISLDFTTETNFCD